MKNLIALSYLLALPLFLLAQSNVNYNDVAVIVNTNSQTSINVGNYFKTQRNIPDQNIIEITATTEEEIDSLQFEAIRTQVEDYMVANNLTDNINYLVTTKGVPLKVHITACNNEFSIQNCPSFDSEISLILGDFKDEIGATGTIFNPYYENSKHFSKAEFGIYLVTRLDAYTEQDIYDLIDRSGPNIPVQQSNTQVIFDINQLNNNDNLFSFFDNKFNKVISQLNVEGWTTNYDPAQTVLTDQSNIIGYNSLFFRPEGQALTNFNFDWHPGAVGNLIFNTTASTLDTSQNVDNYILIGDLIKSGITGVYGNSALLYASQMPDEEILYNTYFNKDSSYNLAESYFQSLRTISLPHVIIGDPKTSLEISITSSTNNPSLAKKINIFPNPSPGQVQVNPGTLQVYEIAVYDSVGRLVATDQKMQPSETFSIDLDRLSKGLYILDFFTDEGIVSKKLVISQ